jgi:hypothetical protein
MPVVSDVPRHTSHDIETIDPRKLRSGACILIRANEQRPQAGWK